jgi:hypothetical protein
MLLEHAHHSIFMKPERQIPSQRKSLYYVGMAVTAVGFLTFISVFISTALHFGDFSNFQQRSRFMALRAIIGMIMMIGGNLLMRTGRMGLAGSGLKLDPEEARRDVEPWARMGGGVVKDALDEAGVKLGGQQPVEQLPFDERLRRLQKLRQDGLISESEFEATRKRILEEA